MQKLFIIPGVIKSAVFSIACFVCISGLGQQPGYHVQVINREGLTDPGQVLEIIRDNRGFLWLLSGSKVQRFDGKNFRSFSFEDRCASIRQDEEGTIWMVSYQNIYRYKNDYTGFEKLPGYSSPTTKYLKLSAGPGKKIYLLTANAILQWNRGSNHFDSLNIPVNTSGSFPVLKNYGDWLFYRMSNTALARYNVKTKALDSVAVKGANFLTPINADSAWVRQGIGSSAVVSFKTKTIAPIAAAQFDEKFNDGRYFITGGSRGFSFISFNDKGYFTFNPATKKFSRIKLFYNGLPLAGSPPINSFYEEENGTIWFANEEGLVHFNPGNSNMGLLRSNNTAAEKWNNDIRNITEDEQGNIWFATANGFCRLDKISGTVKTWLPEFESDNYLNYSSVKSIGYSNGKIIVGQSELCQQELWIFDPATNSFKRPEYESDSSKKILEGSFNSNMVQLRNGDFLILSRRVWLMGKENFKVHQVEFSGFEPVPRTAYEDGEGRIWLLGRGGIVALDKNFKLLYSLPDKERGRWYNAIVQINATTFWVTSKSLFEIKLQPGGKLELLPIFPELKNVHFSHLYKDSLHNIWMFGDNGIYHYLWKDKVLEKFDRSDNVQPYDASVSNSFRSRDGTLYTASTNGVNYFVPEKMSVQKDSLQIHLTNVTVNQDDSSYVSGHFAKKLTYSQNSFVFDFIATYLYNGEKVQYRYKLPGADKNWVNLGNNTSVRVTSLQPGAYSFYVAASLNGKDWFEAQHPFSFTIAPPYWRTWWFVMLAVLLAAAAIWWFIYSLQQKLKVERVINSFATSLYGQNTTDDIFWDMAKNCIEKLGFTDCVIYQRDEHREMLIQKAAYGPKNPYRREILNAIEIPVGKGIVGAAAQSGKAVIVANTAKDPRYIVDDEKRFSEISVPVFIDGKVFAIIDSEHPKKNFYSRFHLKALKKIGAICSERITKHLTEERLRAKIARDLHDEMGSTLTSINIISKIAMEEKPEQEKVIPYQPARPYTAR